MKIAVLSESPADETAIRVLVEGILGRPTQAIAFPPLRTRGWRGALNSLPTVFKHLHYRTDAEALVVVVDSDRSPIHSPARDQLDGRDEKCRLCQLIERVERVQSQLRPRSGRPPLKTALGLAVPAVEAWYRCGLDPRVSEAAWIGGLQARRYPYTMPQLKKDVYGVEQPPLLLETRRAAEEARRLTQDLVLLESLFQSGFGSLARAIRSW